MSQPDPFKEFAVSQSQVATIAAAPQRSEAWMSGRKWRLTGSNFAAAAGHNPYTTQEALVREMLWGTFTGNAATEWGTRHEPVACAMYETHMRATHPDFVVEEHGLQVIPEYPFIGVSPDGICTYWDAAANARVRFLLEIKCPFRWKADGFYDGVVPLYYWDQLQGLMGFLRLPFADFVVWTPVGMQVSRIRYDADYFEGVLRPALLHWYTNIFYPVLCGWREGAIEPPNLVPTLQVDIVDKKE